mgnify:CR=1 FL=1
MSKLIYSIVKESYSSCELMVDIDLSVVGSARWRSHTELPAGEVKGCQACRGGEKLSHLLYAAQLK